MRKKGKMLVVLGLIVSLIYSAANPYVGNGVELDVDINEFGPQWSIFLNTTYGSRHTDINLDGRKSAFTNTNAPVVIACRRFNSFSEGSPIFKVVSTLSNTSFYAQTTGSNIEYDNATAVWWYDKDNARFGTSAAGTAQFFDPNTCDSSSDLGLARICWELGITGNLEPATQARCGEITTASDTYERLVLFQPCFGKPNGSPCSDGNECHLGTKTCQAGVCTYDGGDVVCPPSTDCVTSLGCDQMTGECVFRNRTNGTPCSTGNLCQLDETCSNGVCQGGNAVVCPIGNVSICIGQGTCQPLTGDCSTTFLADGTLCGDVQNACQADRCDGGTCQAGVPKPCPTLNPCNFDGTCNPETGACLAGPVNVGNNCTVGNDLCALTGACDAGGVCQPASTLGCFDDDPCIISAVCDSDTGDCVETIIPDGQACPAPGDSNACTLTDTCFSGRCVGSNPKFCDTGGNPCREPGTCNPISGTCSTVFSPAGKICGTNPCNAPDTCDGSGSCISGTPVPCPSMGQCFNTVGCNPLTGCEYTQVADGTPCTIPTNPCILSAECDTGLCVPTNLDLSGPCEPEPDSASELFSIWA